ncbi:MAG: class I tRNA ligase family protein, partial [Clostridia bacterium]|nr:class I tRNA ligase family protein [Clostridia bacterium]
LIHGLVRDAQGRKMSKSLGNGLDPLEIIDKYGADALRFALATGNSPGNDMRFSDEKIEAARNFANKLWNAARFVMMNLDIDRIELPDAEKLAPEDKWILTKLSAAAAAAESHLENYEIGVALSAIYDFIWDEYCDWYIELSKKSVSGEDKERSQTAQNVLAYVLRETLKLLHPFMPFITEEIYSGLPGEDGYIMVKDYPVAGNIPSFPSEAEDMERVIAAIGAIRQRRAEMGVKPSRRTSLFIATKYPKAFEGTEEFFKRLAGASSLDIVSDHSESGSVRIVTDSATVFIPMTDLVDPEEEKARLRAELDKVNAEIARVEGKLSNKGFTEKAPAAVVDAERVKLAKFTEKKDGITAALAALGE